MRLVIMFLNKKLFRSGIATLGLALFLGLFITASAQVNPIKETLDRMDNNYKLLSSLKSDVTMVKTNAQLGTKDVSQGATIYLPERGKQKMYVRIDWTKPTAESMLVIGKEYKLYRPKLGQAIEGTTSDAKNSGSAGGALAFISMSKAQVKANYDVRYVGVEDIKDGTKTIHLQLTPKTKTTYKTADLWVDTNGMPRQATVTENNDDSTTVLLTNIKTNVSIKTEVFALKYAPGTKIVKS